MSWLQKLFSPKKSDKKIIYFVRHGETILNAQHIRQGSEGSLSEKGKHQASQTGERLQAFPIEVILVSPFQRTRETAAIINQYVNKPIEYNDLLKERQNPKEIIGKWADDPEVRKITDLIDKSFHEGNLRYSDEENYEDLKKRAEKLLDYLATRQEHHILCVTHGIFLTMVIAFMENRDQLTAQDYIKLAFLNPATNAGITVCQYDPAEASNPKKGWELIAWNDYNRHV
jgi:probable phosphoglycerate mutase